MEKKRVYEVAREFHLSSEALLEVLRGMGYTLKGHMSVVNEEMRAAIVKKFEEEKEAQKKELERKKKKIEARRRAERVSVKKERKWRKKPGVKPSEKPKGRYKKDRPKVDQKAV